MTSSCFIVMFLRMKIIFFFIENQHSYALCIKYSTFRTTVTMMSRGFYSFKSEQVHKTIWPKPFPKKISKDRNVLANNGQFVVLSFPFSTDDILRSLKISLIIVDHGDKINRESKYTFLKYHLYCKCQWVKTIVFQCRRKYPVKYLWFGGNATVR